MILSINILLSRHQANMIPVSSIEMIALHLDATNAEFYSRKEFVICFFELSRIEDDRLTVRQIGDEHVVANETLSQPRVGCSDANDG